MNIAPLIITALMAIIALAVGIFITQGLIGDIEHQKSKISKWLVFVIVAAYLSESAFSIIASILASLL